MTKDEILADYNDLEYEDILATLAFATRLSQVKRLSEDLNEDQRYDSVSVVNPFDKKSALP